MSCDRGRSRADGAVEPCQRYRICLFGGELEERPSRSLEVWSAQAQEGMAAARGRSIVHVTARDAFVAVLRMEEQRSGELAELHSGSEASALPFNFRVSAKLQMEEVD
jgi:hypothetical protein